MFETANTTVYARSNRTTVFEAVTFSIILHAAIGVAALAGNLWQVTFPDQSPATIISFVLADPTPPPPPPPPAKPLSKPQQVQTAAIPPDQIVAPTSIPDEIPVVENTIVSTVALNSAPEGVEGGVAWGIDGGSAGGIVGGEIGGIVGGVLGGAGEGKPQAGVVEVERDKPLPMFPMSQVYPSYPEDARIKSWEDDLVVRYTIGRDGRVKSVQVIRHPEHEVFVDGTVRAIRSWRFKPLVRDGQRQEVIHELTIQYRLHQVS